MGANRGLLTLAFLAAFLTFPWLGDKPFYTRGEPREAIVASSMASSGNFILPPAYGDAIPSKPPFMHWWINVFSKITGHIDEVSARLPSAFGSFFFLLCFYRFLLRRRGESFALLSCLLLLGATEWYRAMTISRVDMLFSALFSGGLLALFVWEEKRLSSTPYLAILAFTAATLTKGPVALVLPAIIFTLYLFTLSYRPRAIFRCVALVFIPSALLASIWYGLAFRHGGGGFGATIYYENIARFTRTMDDDPHSHSVFYLFAVLWLGLLPWSFLFFAAFVSELKLRWPQLKDIRASFFSLDRVSQFTIISSVSIFIFYCVPSSKRSAYLLPAYPFLCALIAGHVLSFSDKQFQLFRKTTIFLASLVLLTALALFVVAKFPWLGMSVSKSGSIDFLFRVLANISLSEMNYRLSLLMLPIIIAVIILLRTRFGSDDATLGASIGLVFAIFLSVDAGLMPRVATALSPQPFAQELSSQLPADEPLYSFGNEFYGLSFYLQRQMHRVKEEVPTDGAILLYESDFVKLASMLPASMQLQTVIRSPTCIVRPEQYVIVVRVVSK